MPELFFNYSKKRNQKKKKSEKKESIASVCVHVCAHYEYANIYLQVHSVQYEHLWLFSVASDKGIMHTQQHTSQITILWKMMMMMVKEVSESHIK